MRVALALLALLALGVTFRGPTIEGPSAGTGPGYYTLVVFGDSQKAMEDCRILGAGRGRCAEFKRQVDWVISNAETERIAAVLHVGDMISAGIGLPPYGSELAECDFENGAPYVSDSFVCSPIAVEATCKSTSGCFWNTDPVDGPAGCASCDLVERAQTEWTAFEAQWDRLLPGGDLADGIPAVVSCGNHDNAGDQNATDSDREPQGCNQRFSSAVYDALDGAYGARQFEHVASLADSATGDAHTFLLGLGPQQFVLVSLACCTLEGIPDAQEAWALDQLDNYPTLPAIVLAHDAAAVEATIIDSGDAPNVFAYIGGHVQSRSETVRTVLGKSILKSITDWTTASGTVSDDHDETSTVRSDYLTLIRVYANESPTKIEAFGFSPASGKKNTRPANLVGITALEILP